MSVISTKFKPGEHGFHFDDNFFFTSTSQILHSRFSLLLKLSFLSTIIGTFLLEMVSKRRSRAEEKKLRYGVSQGLCFTALDFFYSNVPLPLFDSTTQAMLARLIKKLSFFYLCRRVESNHRP